MNYIKKLLKNILTNPSVQAPVLITCILVSSFSGTVFSGRGVMAAPDGEDVTTDALDITEDPGSPDESGVPDSGQSVEPDAGDNSENFDMQIVDEPSYASVYNGSQIAASTAPLLKAVDYKNNATITGLLAPSYYTSTDKYNKRTEIAKREGKNINQVADDDVLKELKRDYIIMAYGRSFDNVQQNIEQIIENIINNLNVTYTYVNPETEITNNPEKLLVGLAYLDRMYDFEMGGQNIRDILTYNPYCYSRQMTKNQLAWLIQIGGAGADNLRIYNGTNMFGAGRIFTSNITNASTLGEFLEENRQKFCPGITLDEWFADACKAYIVEKGVTGSASVLYSRMWADTSLRTHILPLLNLSENSMYIITNPATITYGLVDCYVDRGLEDSNPSLYRDNIRKFHDMVDNTADRQYEFIMFCERMCKPELKSLLSTNRIVMDSLRIYTENTVGDASAEWSEKFGVKAALGVEEFVAPMNMYTNYMFADGEASGTGIRMIVSKALTDRGLATYDHEMMHLIVSDVMLFQYGIRDGMCAEVYTRGMFETYESVSPPAFNMNFIYDRSEMSDRFHNAVPSRFQSEADLQVYMRGILDVVYTLDYAEACSILTRSAADKQKWFHKLLQKDDTGTRLNQGGSSYTHKLDEIVAITLDEAAQLNTLEDLVDKSIISARYEVNGMETLGTLASNGYYVVPLFSSNYAGVQNDRGVSGDATIRRQAFELLAEYGYSGGMVPYISNQYKAAAVSDGTVLSDTYILNKIFGGEYGDMVDFRKAMFQKRIDKVGQLVPVTITWDNQEVKIDSFKKLCRLMDAAVESDLQNVTPISGSINNIRAMDTKVELLKAEIYKAYMKLTNDFSNTIYTDGQKLPDTFSGDRTRMHITVFGILSVLVLLAYILKVKVNAGA